MLLKKGNRQADLILRKKKKIGLVPFLRQGRVVNKSWKALAAEIATLTTVNVHGSSLRRAAKRANIR